ncbi:MAG: hypothetical protein ACOC43_07680 [Desulfohalobiaceae bacterium]
MGELLQIRVSAWLLQPEKALRRWPRLTELAFGPYPKQDLDRQNIVELLIDALQDKMKTDQLPQALEQDLLQEISRAYSLQQQLMQRLAEWDPKEADRLSYLIEDHLDSMEEKAPEC